MRNILIYNNEMLVMNVRYVLIINYNCNQSKSIASMESKLHALFRDVFPRSSTSRTKTLRIWWKFQFEMSKNILLIKKHQISVKRGPQRVRREVNCARNIRSVSAIMENIACRRTLQYFLASELPFVCRWSVLFFSKVEKLKYFW